jgi:hypothetical protein
MIKAKKDTKEKATKGETYADFVLPASIVTRIDISHLVKEVEWVDNELTSYNVRSKAGAHQKDKPAFTAQLSEFLEKNSLDLDDGRERTALIKQLRLLKDKAPMIHMTFAAQADGESLKKLVAWLRESIHPQAIIEVGLQPALIGGVYVRTPNHVHDLSLRGKLKSGHELLVNELEAVRGGK